MSVVSNANCAGPRSRVCIMRKPRVVFRFVAPFRFSFTIIIFYNTTIILHSCLLDPYRYNSCCIIVYWPSAAQLDVYDVGVAKIADNLPTTRHYRILFVYIMHYLYIIFYVLLHTSVTYSHTDRCCS